MVGDRDRERIISTLREHYARGRLTLEEFSARSDLVFASRSYGELRTALRGLPVRLGGTDLVEIGDAVARVAVRGAVLFAVTCAYVVFSLTLALVVVLTLVLHGATASVLLVFLAAWAIPSYLVARMWRRVHLPSFRRVV
ncbi:MAG TPA: DUF1707 domain-containing protein [Gaiellales bacterium]|jgi:hypothetical protein|nr:DUF1707 domain-containing protein [Gaiellales bacterium]